MKKKLVFGTIADPLESFDREAETTYFILNEITRRKYDSWVFELKDMYLEGDRLFAKARKIAVTRKAKTFSHDVLDARVLPLDSLDCLFLRKDPPIDERFLNHLMMLEVLEAAVREGRFKGPFMINSPHGIRLANEKIFGLRFPELCPLTVLSADKGVLLDFLKRHKKCVLKPLNSSGGKGVFLIGSTDPNRSSLLETASHQFTQYVLLQKYIPAAKKGDKRVLLINGEPVGCFLRVPSKDDFRGNMHSGARWVRSTITAGEQRAIRHLAPALIQEGLFFVGLDFIGGKITEINTTSPMGFREINSLEGIHGESHLFDWIQSRFSGGLRRPLPMA